jgi:hypothetical protein
MRVLHVDAFPLISQHKSIGLGADTITFRTRNVPRQTSEMTLLCSLQRKVIEFTKKYLRTWATQT